MQATALPEAKGAEVGTTGVQLITAAAGKPVIPQLAAMALSGPPLVQVKLPVTVLPTSAAVGRLTTAFMSALLLGATVALAVLLAGVGSGVELPAVTVADTGVEGIT